MVRVAKLVTIPASNFAEKARWALQLAGVEFTESKYAPVLAYASTKPKGGRSVPLLVLPATSDGSSDKVLADSSDILDFCATKLPALYPTPDTKALELLFDKKLGPAARCCAYHVLFMDSAAGRQILAGPLGFFQSYLTWLLYPLLVSMLKRALKVNATSAERMWLRVEDMAKEAEKRLGDEPVGARFLGGDAFSAADIAFCAHMSLLLFPPEHRYIGPFMSTEKIRDPVFKQRLEALRASKVGQYVLWCYAHRRPAMLPRAKL